MRRRALQEKYPAPSSYSYSRSEVGPVSLAYVVDVFAKDFVYHEPDGTLCKLGYLVDKSGKVEIDSGAPTKVRRTTSYQPVGNAEFYEEIHSWYELVANDAGCGKECKCKDCKKKNKVEQPSEDAYSGNSSTNNQLILNRRVNVKKTEMIAELIANCSCWEKEDEAALNAMPEAKLKTFFDHHTEHQSR